MKFNFIVLLLLWIVKGSLAQNNAIFSGGTNDGTNRATFLQAGNNIFTGGSGDGWFAGIYQQQANAIFTGGIGDGWASTVYLQAGNSIFEGGNNDGWSAATFLQSGNAIFDGGLGDGWNHTMFLQPANNIFSGGVGDGWSSTYRPMGTIPVNFLYFNASNQGSTSLLNWKTSQEINSAHFEVERSVDAVNFSYIGRVNASGNSQVPLDYYFTDNNPVSGLNYYRLKQVDLDGRFIYTPARVVRFDQTTQNLVKYYPNPTNGLLNIELIQSMQAEPKVVNISNTAGVVLEQLKLSANSNSILQINLSNYPRGVYFVQVKTANINSVQRIVLQ